MEAWGQKSSRRLFNTVPGQERKGVKTRERNFPHQRLGFVKKHDYKRGKKSRGTTLAKKGGKNIVPLEKKRSQTCPRLSCEGLHTPQREKRRGGQKEDDPLLYPLLVKDKKPERKT